MRCCTPYILCFGNENNILPAYKPPKGKIAVLLEVLYMKIYRISQNINITVQQQRINNLQQSMSTIAEAAEKIRQILEEVSNSVDPSLFSTNIQEIIMNFVVTGQFDAGMLSVDMQNIDEGIKQGLKIGF